MTLFLRIKVVFCYNYILRIQIVERLNATDIINSYSMILSVAAGGVMCNENSWISLEENIRKCLTKVGIGKGVTKYYIASGIIFKL